jgi:serine protease inhibitor
VLISSNVHLATAWAGNTFSVSKPFNGPFHTESGVDREVEMLKSELSVYRHAKTATFEAVALPCNLGHMVAVLPPPGGRILELERELARSPELLDQALNQEIGWVTLPPFHIKAERDLAPHLKKMGVRRVFEDLGRLLTIPASYFSEVKQSVDIQVDRSGIRADAGTVIGAIELPRLRRLYGKGRWRKMKGVARIRLRDGRIRLAELHWYEAHGIGKKEFKRKKYFD